MRTFVALRPPGPLKESIGSAVDAARAGLAARWVPWENLHLTLAFLGDVPPERLGEVELAAQETAAAAEAFEVELGKVGAFPNLRRPRVLFLRAGRGGEEIVALAASLRRRLPPDLAPASRGPLRPHLTLARIRDPREAGDVQPFVAQLASPRFTFFASHLSVMESQLGPGKAQHVVRREVALPSSPS